LDFTVEELTANAEDALRDPRYGLVFTYLNTSDTLSRYYNQLKQHEDIIAANKLQIFQTVLINQRYLDPNSPNYKLASKTIVIDSPGWTSATSSASEMVKNYEGNLKLFQALRKLSNTTLFFIPAANLNLISNQLAVLELCVLYSMYGLQETERLIHAATQGSKKEEEEEGFLSPLMKAFSTKKTGKLQGTAHWANIYFVLSRIDELGNSQNNLRRMYYELGGKFQESFSYLPNPVADNLLTMSLPDKARELVESDRESLLERLRVLADQSPIEKRIDAAIHDMAYELRQKINQSWLSTFMSSDGNMVDAILDRCMKRMNGQSTT